MRQRLLLDLASVTIILRQVAKEPCLTGSCQQYRRSIARAVAASNQEEDERSARRDQPQQHSIDGYNHRRRRRCHRRSTLGPAYNKRYQNLAAV